MSALEEQALYFLSILGCVKGISNLTRRSQAPPNPVPPSVFSTELMLTSSLELLHSKALQYAFSTSFSASLSNNSNTMSCLKYVCGHF